MKRTLTIVQAIRELLADHRDAKQKERITKALKAHAKACSDAEYNKTMHTFYCVRVNRIDPWKDHNAFAEARNNQQEYADELADSFAACDEAAARLAAEQARYVQLHNGLQEARQ